MPLHLQNAYESLGYKKEDFRIAECASDAIVSLPMFPQLSRDQQDWVVANFVQFHTIEVARGAELVNIA